MRATKWKAKVCPKWYLVLSVATQILGEENEENSSLKHLLTIRTPTNVRCDSQLPCGSAGSKRYQPDNQKSSSPTMLNSQLWHWGGGGGGGASAVTRNRPVGFVTASFTNSCSRSSDKTHYQKNTRPWHNIGEGGLGYCCSVALLLLYPILSSCTNLTFSVLVIPKPLHLTHFPPSKSATLQHYPSPPSPILCHGLVFFFWSEFSLMIDCNWSWNLQLQNPLVCFSWRLQGMSWISMAALGLAESSLKFVKFESSDVLMIN